MLSYAQSVKNELAHKFDKDINCLRAEFVALLKVGAKKIDGRFEFSSINAAVARRLITLAKKFLPHVKPEVAAVRRKKLYKTLRYVVRFIAVEVQNFFDTLDFAELTKRTRYKVAYLRGAFLARGRVNRPESYYFLTISSFTEAESQFLRKLMEHLDFRAGFYVYKKDFILWLREGDAVCDFLGMIGAQNAVERFEVARNLKEVRLQVNRIVNLETAALNKSIEAAQAQIADIKLLLEHKVPVKDKLREAMELRLENPTCTTYELAEKIGMSQPGILYRFHMINHLANKTRRMLRRR